MSDKPKRPCPVCSSLLAPGEVCARCLIGGVLDRWDEPIEPRPPAPAAAPRLVGEYELIEELGRGGMGIVWRARQRRLNREVALKLVREGCLPGESAARRFRREAEAAAAIQHPHIVTIHEVGESDDRLYLSMELVPGGSLADWMKRVAFSAHDAAKLVSLVARAVHHAHQQGVLHRDLKPANILLDAAGEPRVCDFGLARLIEDTSTLTMTGEVLGTPAYLSPEQASGTRAVTTASDTYSLGAILYEMISGRPPFAANSLPALLRAVAEDDPQKPISRISGRRVPVDLSTICMKCLEKEPSARYSSALALAEDLDRWIRGEPILARPVARVERVWKWARRKPLLAGLWLALTLLTVGIAVFSTTMSFRLSKEKQAVADAALRTRHALARSLSDSAQRYMNIGDSFRALPALADAIEIGTGDPRLDEVNRIRFGVIRRISPKLSKFWGGETVVRADATRDGTRIMLAFEHRIEVRDTATGNLVGKPFASEKVVSGAVFDALRGGWVALETNNDCFVWEPESGLVHDAGKGILYSSPEGSQHTASFFITHLGQTAEVHSKVDGLRVGRPLEHHARVVWAVVLPGLNRALTRDENAHIYLWDIETSTLVLEPFTLPGSSKGPSFDAYHVPSKVAVLHAERVMWMLDCQTGSAKIVPVWKSTDGSGGPPQLGRESTQSVGMENSRRWLYMSRNNDGTTIRELETGEIIWSAFHGALGFRGDFGGSTDLVATQSSNGSARVWRSGNARPITPFLWQAATPGSCRVDPSGGWMLTQGDEPAARLWTIPPEDGAQELPGEFGDSAGLWFAGVPERLFLAEENGNVGVWEVGETPRKRSGIRHPEPLIWTGPAARGARIFTAGKTLAKLWDSATGESRGKELKLDAEPVFAASDPSGDRFAIVAADGTVRIWNAIAGHELRMPAKAKRVEFSQNGKVLLVIGEKGVSTWDPATGKQLAAELPEPEGKPEAVVSPDGTRIVQWSGEGSTGLHTARLWDSATGRIVCTLGLHWQGIGAAAFSPDGKLVATGGDDHMLRLADAQTGADVVPPMRHPQKVSKCGFSADGLLVWGQADSDFIVWDTVVGEQVTPRLRHPRSPHYAIGSADGRKLAILGAKNTARLWDLRAETLPTADLQQVSHVLSAHKLVPGSSTLCPLLPVEARTAWDSTKAILGVWKD